MSIEQFVEKVAWPGAPDLLLWGIMKVLQPRHLNSMSQNQKMITHLKPPSLELLIVKKKIRDEIQ